MLFEKFKTRFPRVKQTEPLKNHCTFRVGGPADYFYELTDLNELPDLITFALEHKLPYLLIGRGSNILFLDGGFRGLIIKNLTKNLTVDGTSVTADSGVLLSEIIRQSVAKNLTGLEPLYGLPGTIGGAVFGNAGIPGVEISNFLKKIVVFHVPSREIRDLPKEKIEFRYRWSSLQKGDYAILEVTLELSSGNAEHSKNKMKEIDAIRRGKQPAGFTAGSFFKNPSHSPSEARARIPKEQSAGYLIDQVGLKGFSIGDAQISEKHANFFMNRGFATATQILELAALAKKKVKEKFGLDLHEEVRILGIRKTE